MLHIILNEMRSFFRNGSTLFLSIVFPSLLTFILGTLLEDVQKSDAVVGDLNVAYCVEEGGYQSAAFEEYILALDEEKVITAEKVTADKLGNAAENYSAAVELKGGEIIVYKGRNAIQNRTVRALMDGYNENAGAYMSVAAVDPTLLSGVKLSDEEYVEQKDFGRTRTMMDYYAVAMTVVIIFFGSSMGGASSYSDERSFNTLDRLSFSPVSRTRVFFGKIIGSLPVVLIQVGTVMIVSILFFGVHFCDTLGGNLLLFAMFVSVSLTVLAVGVLFGLLFPKIPAMPVIMPIAWVMLFFSGAFYSKSTIDGISEYLPPKLLLNAAFDLTVFSRSEQAISVTLWSLGIFAVLLAAGWACVNIRRRNA
ncbi:MAG: ABC transporter permease [Oscillospiraceae bacterium]|nr:ABC transporter permease [Oscillospiraceae bacterium]